VASPVLGLRAEQADPHRAGKELNFCEGKLKFPLLHVVRVTSKARSSPCIVGRVLAGAPKAPKLFSPYVADPGGRKKSCQGRSAEVRVPSGMRPATHIHYAADIVFLEKEKKRLGLPCRMAEGVHGTNPGAASGKRGKRRVHLAMLEQRLHSVSPVWRGKEKKSFAEPNGNNQSALWVSGPKRLASSPGQKSACSPLEVGPRGRGLPLCASPLPWKSCPRLFPERDAKGCTEGLF
jgi:hypothetical protein